MMTIRRYFLVGLMGVGLGMTGIFWADGSLMGQEKSRLWQGGSSSESGDDGHYFDGVDSTDPVPGLSGGAPLEISGYVQGSFLRFQTTLPVQGEENWLETRLQHRISVSWDVAAFWSLRAEARTRLFAGDLVKDISGYAAATGNDPGWVDLSKIWTEQNSWFLMTDLDRLFAEWDREEWNIRAGRQRINWGMGLISQPHDLFNLYSFYDLDYAERPGSDAIRVRRYVGDRSRVEFAVAPGSVAGSGEGTGSVPTDIGVAAFLLGTTWRHVDLQMVGGWYRNRPAAGFGWAADLQGFGIKGESMVYGRSDTSGDRFNAVAALSGEYMFDNGLFWIGELLYNHDGRREEFSILGSLPSADNPSFTRTQWTTVVSYPVSILIQVGIAAGWYPGEEAVYLSPNISVSLSNQMDWQMAGQWFTGAEGSLFEDAGSVLYTSLKWYY